MVLTVIPWDDFRQFLRQAPALVQGGHEVIYFCGKPDRKVETSVRMVPLPPRQKKWARLTGGINLFRHIVSYKPEAVHLSSVELLPLGLMLKLLTRVKVIYDCREDMFHSLRDHKDWSFAPAGKVLAWAVRGIEYLAAKTFDGMVVSDPALFSMHQHMPDDRKMIFYNTPQLSLFKSAGLPWSERKYDVTMMGSMSPRTGATNLIEAAGMLKRRGKIIRVLLLGQPTPSVLPEINRLIDQYDLADQVTITGWIPHEQVPDLLGQVKIGVVGLLDMPKFRNNIACKAFEYMACSMPVVSSDLPPERIFIEEGKTGLYFTPGCTEELAQAIQTLLDDPVRAESMGNEGRKAFENRWNCENDQKNFRQFYERILARPGR